MPIRLGNSLRLYLFLEMSEMAKIIFVGGFNIRKIFVTVIIANLNIRNVRILILWTTN